MQHLPPGPADATHAPSLDVDVGLEQIAQAKALIEGRVLRTPMVLSPSLSERMGVEVYLKLECHQTTGSFKLRGATHAILKLDPVARSRGVVTASTGNHGRALAYAAQALGVPVVVCMSHLVPENKVHAIRHMGAEVCITGHSQDDAQVEALRLVQSRGLTFIPAFDHLDVVLGQATLGLEMIEQLPEMGTVVVPLSGGGLFSGVALGCKLVNPEVQAIGVSMEAGCAMHSSLRAGHPVDVEEVPTLADSLGGGIGLDNRHTFRLLQALANRTLLVNEDAIALGIRHAYMEEREVLEGAGAVGISAVLSGQLTRPTNGRPIVLLLSGRNIDMRLHQQLVCKLSA